MQKNIHDILKDAGAAKGITTQEVLTIIALKNGDIMKDFEISLQKYVDEGSLPEKIFQKAMLDMENASEALQSIDTTYKQTVTAAYYKAFDRVSTDYLQDKKSQLATITQKFSTLLS